MTQLFVRNEDSYILFTHWMVCAPNVFFEN
jgi:hypothetical protein